MSNLFRHLISWITVAPESVYNTHTNKNLAEAFVELGKLRLENKELKESDRIRKQWLEEAKERAGYSTYTSFDTVFDDLLASAEELKRYKNEQSN